MYLGDRESWKRGAEGPDRGGPYADGQKGGTLGPTCPGSKFFTISFDPYIPSYY